MRTSPLHDNRSQRVGWVMVARDVTAINGQRRELEQANARLHEQLRTIELLRADLAEQAVRDALTGLYNRRYLLEALERLAAECAVRSRR
nr:hypothetical protein GCM10020093_064690 [Planobispora longispora]